MITLLCEQNNPTHGHIKIILRIHEQLVYMKFNNTPQKDQMVNSLRSRGASIVETRGWLRVNIFADHGDVKLGNYVFNVKDKKPSEVEIILYDFFKKKYSEAKFTVKEVVE